MYRLLTPISHRIHLHLGFDYFDHPDTDEVIKNSFLVALHGSTDATIGHGYKIVIMRKGQNLRPLWMVF